MEAFTVHPHGMSVVPSIDITGIPRAVALAVLARTQMILKLPKNSLLICADKTQINVGVSEFSVPVLCFEAQPAPKTMAVTLPGTVEEPWFVCVSEEHPYEQRVLGVVVFDIPRMTPVAHAFVLNPSYTNRPHYCGWFESVSTASDFIFQQCFPFVPRPHRRRAVGERNPR